MTTVEPDIDPGARWGAALADPDGPADPASARSIIAWVLGRQRRHVVVGALAGITWMGSIALLPVVLGLAIDRAVDPAGDGGPPVVAAWSAAIAGVVALEAGAGVLRHRTAVLLYVRSRWLVERLVTRRVLDPRGGLDVDGGTLVSLTANEAQRIGGIADLMCRGSGAVVTFAAVGIGMVVTSPLLGALVLLGLPPCLLLLVPVIRPYERRSADQQARLAEASSTAADAVTGLRVVKGLGAEPAVRRWFGEATAAVRDSAVGVARLEATWVAITTAVPGVFLAVVLLVAGRQAVDGTLSPGQLVTFAGLAVFLAIPLSTLAEVGDVWTAGVAAGRRLAAVLAVPPAVDDPAGAAEPLTGGVALHGVAHGPLIGVDLRVEAGVVGVVVADDRARRALLDLLGRRVDPEEGVVAVGGVDARELPLDVLRRVVVVERAARPWVDGGSLRDALALGSPGAPDDALLDALLVAAGDDLAARHDPLDVAVGERGLALSGGQRQRVAVARAVLPDPPVLVLEDPTGALDVVTEQHLLDRLTARRVGRATLLVTTSPAALAACGRVVLIDGGRVVAEGRHGDLLRSTPAYAAVVDPGEAA